MAKWGHKGYPSHRQWYRYRVFIHGCAIACGCWASIDPHLGHGGWQSASRLLAGWLALVIRVWISNQSPLHLHIDRYLDQRAADPTALTDSLTSVAFGWAWFACLFCCRESHWSGSRVQRLHSRISDTLTVTPTIPGCQTVPQIHETLSHCWINDGPASYTVDQHWLNKGSVSRVCWDTVMANTPMIPARHLVMVRVWLLMRTNTISHVGLMLCQRRRRWHNIKPTWDQQPVFGVYPAAVHRLATQHNTKYINRKGCWLKHQSDQQNGQRHRKTVSDAHGTNKSTDLLVRVPAILRGDDTTHSPLS